MSISHVMRNVVCVLVASMCAACAATAPALTPSTSAPTVISSATSEPTAAVLATALPSTQTSTQTFDGERAYESVVQQVALGPRITGSEPNRELGDQILAQLAANGWMTSTQAFSYQGTPTRNLIGTKGNGGDIIILGAHYDTRRRTDQDKQKPTEPVPGANDGASGVAVLLELSRVLDVDKTGKQVWLAFFDAEDNGDLDGWDWIVGSRYFAANMTVTPTAVVIVDMIGDRQQEIYLESNSNRELATQIWDVAQQMGYGDQFIKQMKWSMTDDHMPFLERGLRAVDIIDFDYPYWHTVQDTPDKVSPESLEHVGRTLEVWLEGDK